jgi:hypothetical protein
MSDIVKIHNVSREAYPTMGEKVERITGSIDLGELRDCAAVPRWDGHGDGYQVPIEGPRVADVAATLAAGGAINGSLIFVATEASGAAYNWSSKKLTFSRVPGAIEVLDGQHRLHGAWLANDAGFVRLYEAGEHVRNAPARASVLAHDPSLYEPQTPARKVRATVEIWLGLTRAQAAGMFEEIHAKAKRKNQAQLAEARYLRDRGAGSESPSDRLYTEMVAEGGVLHEIRFNGRRGLNRAQWAKIVKPILADRGPLAYAQMNARERACRIYFEALHDAMPSELFRLGAVLGAAADCYLDVCDRVLTQAAPEERKLSRESIANVMATWAELDLAALDGRGRGVIREWMRGQLLGPRVLAEMVA